MIVQHYKNHELNPSLATTIATAHKLHNNTAPQEVH